MTAAQNIKVVCRARPREEGVQSAWQISQDSIKCTCDNSKTHLTYDRIFGEKSDSRDIFEYNIRDMIEAAMKGFNGTVFAYGQTGSGKTHTISGTPDAPGIMPQAMKLLFNLIDMATDKQFMVKVTYLEIYNEEVHDLLNPAYGALKLRQNSSGSFDVLGCTEAIVESLVEVTELMEQGDLQRTTAATLMNERSSRSHAVFRISLQAITTVNPYIEGVVGAGDVTTSEINFVDLAGSERQSKTASKGQRLKEASNINKSLLCLSNVINKLSESRKGAHIPYRDSNLTRILMTSLGGNSNTIAICALHLSPIHQMETESTLRFAARCKKVVNKAIVNRTEGKTGTLEMYKNTMELLQQQLEDAKRQVGPVKDAPRSRKISIGSYLRDNNRDSELAERNKMLERREALELKVKQMMDLLMRSGEGPPSANEKVTNTDWRTLSMFSKQKQTLERRLGIKTKAAGGSRRNRTSTVADTPSRGRRSESIVVTMSQWRVGKKYSTSSPFGSNPSRGAKKARPSPLKGKILGMSDELACIAEDEDTSERDEDEESLALQEAIREARAGQFAKQLELSAKQAMRKSNAQEILGTDGSDQLGRLARAVHCARQRQKKLEERIERAAFMARLCKDDGLLNTVLAANAYAIAHSFCNNPIREVNVALQKSQEVLSVMRRVTERKQAEMAPVDRRLQELESLVGNGGWSTYLSAIYVLLIMRPLVLCWYKEGYLQEIDAPCPEFDLPLMQNPLFGVNPSEVETPRLESTSCEGNAFEVRFLQGLANESDSEWQSNSVFDYSSSRKSSGLQMGPFYRSLSRAADSGDDRVNGNKGSRIGSLWRSMSRAADSGDDRVEGAKPKHWSHFGASKLWRSMTKMRKYDQDVHVESTLDNEALTQRTNDSIDKTRQYGRGLLGDRTTSFKPTRGHDRNADSSMPPTPPSRDSHVPPSKDSLAHKGKQRSLLRKATKKISVYYKRVFTYRHRSKS